MRGANSGYGSMSGAADAAPGAYSDPDPAPVIVGEGSGYQDDDFTFTAPIRGNYYLSAETKTGAIGLTFWIRSRPAVGEQCGINCLMWGELAEGEGQDWFGPVWLQPGTYWVAVKTYDWWHVSVTPGPIPPEISEQLAVANATHQAVVDATVGSMKSALHATETAIEYDLRAHGIWRTPVPGR